MHGGCLAIMVVLSLHNLHDLVRWQAGFNQCLVRHVTVGLTHGMCTDIALNSAGFCCLCEHTIYLSFEAQVDMDAYAGENNGMRRLSEVFRGNDFYGEVKLQNIYRSRIAALAQEM